MIQSYCSYSNVHVDIYSGEPKIFVELTNGATITDTQDCPRFVN